MRKFEKAILVIVFMMAGTSMLLSSCQKQDMVDPDYDATANYKSVETDTLNCNCVINPADTIYPFEISMLEYMREEEKLARDVYIKLSTMYALPIFNNISNSEQFHMDRVLCLLNHYEIPDPAMAEIGEFTNSDLQVLYNNLVTQGSASLIDALTVGATIEDLDIFDLNEHIAQTSNEAILTIFEHLRCGSGHHIKAFTRILSIHNTEYIPQFISQDEYDEIINGSFQPCGFITVVEDSADDFE